MTYFPLHQTTCFFISFVAPCKQLLYCFLEKQGYTILPLAQSKTLTGIHYKDGGGFKVNWGGDRILQYHPATGSHHNGAYYKISSGKTGKVRIDLHGNKI